MWRTSITAGDLQHTVARYLGAERAERSFAEYAESSNAPLSPDAEADIHLLRFTEHLLASAIGAASSRLVLSLLLRRGDAGSQSALRLLDDASEALQYNRDLLQSALDQVRHGLSVFDKDMRLICWNRQFRELLNLPPELGRVGAPLDRILRTCAERGDFGTGRRRQAGRRSADEARGRARDVPGALRRRPAHPRRSAPARCRKAASSPPIPTSPSASRPPRRWRAPTRRWSGACASARPSSREVNEALAVAKRKADEANLDKTRFLAAASHDVLQPLNAARLYATSLVERRWPDPEAKLARNIDASLEAVEEILSVLIEISRLDAGRLEPDITVFALQRRVRAPGGGVRADGARERASSCASCRPALWVSLGPAAAAPRAAEPGCPTPSSTRQPARCWSACAGAATGSAVQVCDTGPGIPKGKRSLIFKEFQRLEETAASVRGPRPRPVDRRAHRQGARPRHRAASVPGRGSMFSVELPQADATAGGRARRRSRRRPRAASPGLKVLCIDNEPDVLDGMQALLEGWGCTCHDGAEAAEAIEQLRRTGDVPDIILADYHLDGGTGARSRGGRPRRGADRRRR